MKDNYLVCEHCGHFKYTFDEVKYNPVKELVKIVWFRCCKCDKRFNGKNHLSQTVLCFNRPTPIQVSNYLIIKSKAPTLDVWFPISSSSKEVEILCAPTP